jgi:hypothetical protein
MTAQERYVLSWVNGELTMAEGIYIAPEGDWPALNLTANVRVPQFCGLMALPVNGAWQGIPGYVSGAQAFAMISDVGKFITSMTRPTYRNYTSYVQVSGGSIRAVPGPGSRGDFLGEGHSALVFQALPASGANYGLQLIDSTNLLEISNVGMNMRPIYKWAGMVNGVWDAPVVPGFNNRENYVLFVRCVGTGVAITRNTSLMQDYGLNREYGFSVMQANISGEHYGLGLPGAAYCEVLIFHAADPEVSHSGISIFNSAGQCTWSSKHPPFLMRGTIAPGDGWTSPDYYAGTWASRPMIPVNHAGFSYAPDSVMKQYGYSCNGGAFARVSITSGYTTDGDAAVTLMNDMPMPVIDAADYF